MSKRTQSPLFEVIFKNYCCVVFQAMLGMENSRNTLGLSPCVQFYHFYHTTSELKKKIQHPFSCNALAVVRNLQWEMLPNKWAPPQSSPHHCSRALLELRHDTTIFPLNTQASQGKSPLLFSQGLNSPTSRGVFWAGESFLWTVCTLLLRSTQFTAFLLPLPGLSFLL